MGFRTDAAISKEAQVVKLHAATGECHRRRAAGHLFSRWTVRQGTRWTPQRVAWVALAMTWDDGQNLTDRWDHVCGAMKQVRTHWKLGTAYSGFAAALVRQSGTVCNAVKRRFQQVMQLELSSHWRREGWVVFAVDGTRFEAPHTAANEAGLRRVAPVGFQRASGNWIDVNARFSTSYVVSAN